jgi:hypothetical protein
MRRLDLKNYTFTMNDQNGIARLTPYQFKDTLVNVLTNRSLGLNGPELLDISVVADKVKNADKEVILTDDDYHKITDTLKRFRGFSDPDTQFVRRIFNCPEIPDDGNKVIEFSEN